MDITLKELSKISNINPKVIQIYLANKTIFAGTVINLSELEFIEMQLKFYNRNKRKDKTGEIRKQLQDKLKEIKGA